VLPVRADERERVAGTFEGGSMQIPVEKLVTLYGESQIENKLLNEQFKNALKELAEVRKELEKVTSETQPKPSKPRRGKVHLVEHPTTST
jgi:hypothetical protein